MALLTNKHVVLTGGASGIGLATSHMLVSRGAKLSIADVQQSALDSAISSIKSQFPKANISGMVVNVRERAAVEKWIKESVERHGKIDGAVNLAGVIGKQIGIADVADIEDDDWEFVMGVNLTGTLYCMRAEINNINDGASIVNAASIAGKIGLPKNAAYVASKHAVVGLTRAAAKELGPRGIRVNAIAPGPIDTPMVRKSKETAPNSLLGHIPLGREGRADEVAELICFLLSDGSTYMTGTVQSIDGGWAC